MNITTIAKAVMEDRGWTQKHLAEAVGIHPITLCRLLSHPEKRPLTAYDKLSAYLLANSPQSSPAPQTENEEAGA